MTFEPHEKGTRPMLVSIANRVYFGALTQDRRRAPFDCGMPDVECGMEERTSRKNAKEP